MLQRNKAHSIVGQQSTCELTFTANTAGSTVNFSKITSYAPTVSLEYSTDGGSTWSSYPSNTSGQVITLANIGDTVKFRGTNSSLSTSTVSNRFSITGSVSASGDVTTLLNPRGVKNLSGRTHCFYKLFQNCTGLTTAPELPSTTLAPGCYNTMFEGCTGLITAPELPAMTLVSNCYTQMFNGCTSLNYIKAMFTTEPSNSYTGNWVNGVSATGTFVKNSAATWDVTGASGIPSGWTIQDATA